ncbi:MAG TPA: ABC transporter permease [Gaiellaceae bacterium]|nr:ABC transporter permease [Gaiellaceae bacterium]
MTSVAASTAVVRRAAETRYVAMTGIGLSLIGFWLVLPPVESRTIAWPIAFGAAGAAAGLWAVTQGLRKLGWGTAVVAVACIVLGVAATNSSEAHLEAAIDWGQMVNLMFVFAAPLTFAAVGGMFSERAGVVNIGLEGMMLAGAFFGILGADKLNSWPLGLLTAIAAGAGLGLIHAFLSIHMRADQIVGGTGINFLALGVTGYFFIQIYGENGTPGTGIPEIPDVKLSFLKDIPPDRVGNFLYQAIGHLNLMIWLMFALLVAASVAMFRTSIGLRLRSVGEHPRAADTVGISVYKTRYAAVTLSGMIAALGGAYLSIGYVHSFSENMTAGRGFIGLAALIFGNWRPFGAFGAALLFGFAGGLATRLQEYGYGVQVLVQALPYVLTLIAVAGVIGRSIPPASVGRPYVKQ